MPDELVQQLGFDASDALEALAALDGAMDGFQNGLRTAAETMATWNGQAASTVQILKDISANAASAASAVAKLSSAFGTQQGAASTAAAGSRILDQFGRPLAMQAQQQAARNVAAAMAPVTVPVKPAVDSKPLQDAQSHVQNFVMSWETLGRVVTTQLIVRAMSQVRDAIGEAYEANVAFVKSMAETRAISPERDLAAMTEGVKALSREFNVPIEQVVEAKYQAISNQFVSAAQQAEVLRAAAEASKVGMVDMGKATEIVSGALNVYGKDSAEAEQMTAKMFKAVGEGHIRFGDLSNILSRVGPTARELGVSFDELLAAIDALSIGGMKPAEVATSLRASMTALFKPSHDMTEELHGMSAEQLVAVNGLVGAWQKLRGGTSGSVEEIAKLVANIRGMNAVLRETGSGADVFAKQLEHIKAANAGEFHLQVGEFRSTDVEKITTEMNKLHVFMTTELGADVVKLMNQFAAFTGGADTWISVIRGAIPVVATLAGGFVVLAGNLMLVRANALVAASGMSALGSAVVLATAVAATFAAGNTINDRFVNRQKEVLAELATIERERLAQLKANDEAQYADQKARNEATIHNAIDAVSKVGEAYRQQVADGKAAAHQWSEDTKATMEGLIAGRERGVRLLRDLATEANKEIESSHKRVSDLEGRLSDTQFRFKEGGAGSKPSDLNYLDRAQSLAFQARKAMSAARTPDEEKAAQDIFKRAEAFAQEGMAIAQRSKSAGAQYEAEEAIEGVLRSQIDAEKEFQEQRARTAKEAAAAAAEEEAKVTHMRDLMKDILKEGNPFDAKGKPLSDSQRQENLAKVQRDMEEFQQLAFSGGKWKVSDLLNFAGLKQKMETSFRESATPLQIQELRVAPEKLKALNEQLTHGIGVLDVLVKLVPDKTKLQGLTADEALITAQKQIESQGAALDRLNAKREAGRNLERETVLEAARVSAALEMADSFGGKFMATFKAFHEFRAPKDILADLETVKALRAEVAKASQDMNFGVKEYNELAGRATVLQGTKGGAATEVQYEGLHNAMDILMHIAQLHEQIKAAKSGGDTGAQIKDAQKQLDGLKEKTSEAQRAVEGVSDKTTSVQKATDQLSMESYIDQINEAIGAMNQLASVAQSVPTPGALGVQMTASHGGMAFLAEGGRSRGTDVIPAMLSPHEVVMSPAASRRFASQLTAMNAGVQPSYHSRGGHVTNIGDINVTVKGGDTGRQTARSIASELRRELRRGSSVLQP